MEKGFENDDIFDGVIKLLEETAHSHKVGCEEWPLIAAMVSSVTHSNAIMRRLFYTEVIEVAKRLDKKEEELHKQAGDILRRYRNIWGDAELDEEVCRLLDEEDAANIPKDVDGDGIPKKKVPN